MWVAIEDSDTHEVSDFEQATIHKVLYLMDGYRVKPDGNKFRVRDTENGKNIVYDGYIHEGGFGYNLWMARKFPEA